MNNDEVGPFENACREFKSALDDVKAELLARFEWILNPVVRIIAAALAIVARVLK